MAAGLVAGGVLAGTITASAQDEDSGTSTSSAADERGRPDEELLTGDTKAQVEEAVLAEYPDATIERTETDSGGVYESHIVTADGDRLTVLVGEDFAVTGTETGGHGSGRHGHRPGGPDGPDGPDGADEPGD